MLVADAIESKNYNSFAPNQFEEKDLYQPFQMSRSIREVQQSFAESLGYSDYTIWDLLSNNQAHILRTKINELMRGANERVRETLFNSVWAQRKYTNQQSLTSIFYVLVATGTLDEDYAEHSKSWSCHPVFRARRCLPTVSGNDSSNCCMIYVDANGRVYQNWRSYLNNNELPAGIMVAPRRGVYNLSAKGKVQLVTCVTPQGSLPGVTLSVLDTSSAIGGLGAAGVTIAALLPAVTVAAPVLAVAAAVGMISVGYSSVRSLCKLVDRNQHEQSNTLDDPAARNHWLGFIGGAVGIGAAGATSVMSEVTNAGYKVGTATQLTVNSMNITSMVLSGGGLVNGVFDLIMKANDEDDISAMDVMQLSASLVLFTHSVYNFKLASTIVNETSNSKIGSYRETLSVRQRRMFDKLTKETIRARGPTQGKVDIIRHVNEIPSRQQFNDLYKINKQLNQKGIRPAFASHGEGIMLNEQVITKGADLRASVQHNAGPDILGQVKQPIPEKHTAEVGSRRGKGFTGTLVTQDKTNKTVEKVVEMLDNGQTAYGKIEEILEKFGDNISENVGNPESFKTVLLSFSDQLKPYMLEYILELLNLFMDKIRKDLTKWLKFAISSETVLYNIGIEVLKNYRHDTLEQLETKTDNILKTVKDIFLKLNPNPSALQKCDVCEGLLNSQI